MIRRPQQTTSSCCVICSCPFQPGVPIHGCVASPQGCGDFFHPVCQYVITPLIILTSDGQCHIPHSGVTMHIITVGSPELKDAMIAAHRGNHVMPTQPATGITYRSSITMQQIQGPLSSLPMPQPSRPLAQSRPSVQPGGTIHPPSTTAQTTTKRHALAHLYREELEEELQKIRDSSPL